ncbi:MAG: cyclic nucleotide-binding domain-containing protein [Archangiaceae bacterium]|nr:cyclic nucleotide-binding domain-containing protein [Archangiaceae bacterium]
MSHASSNPALEQFIKSIPLFSLVEPQELMDILRLMRPVQVEAGQVLFREGEPGKAMWVMGKGVEVSVSATPPGQKRPVVVAYAREGEVLGEMALVDDGPRSGTAIVVQGGHAHEIDANEFHALRDGFNSAAFKVLRRVCVDLCARLRATNERIVPGKPTSVSTPQLSSTRRPTPEVMEQFPPFKALPATVKLALGQKLQLVEVAELTPLFAEGEVSDGAWFLLEGEVSVGRNGKTLANLPPGTMFGLVSAIDQGTRSAACVTTGPARLLKLNDRDFDSLFASGNRFAFQLVDLVARQLVLHLRQANAMLSLPGKPSPVAPASKPLPSLLEAARPGAPAPQVAKQFDELDIDFALDEIQIDPDAGILG